MNERSRSFLSPALVIKRTNVGEADRIVTLLTQKSGKLVCVAKGVRKIKSSKRAYLEPGSYIQAYLVKSKSLPLLTQAKLINEFAETKRDLKRMRQLSQVLEITDRLFVEGEEDKLLFEEVLKIIKNLNNSSNSVNIRNRLENIIRSLGYYDQIDQKTSLLDLVSQISDKPMRSWEYLKI